MNDDTRVPAAVFALRPEWADLILSGAKTVEIRRSRMNRMIGRMLIYRTGTGLIVGEVRVKGMHAAPPETIWREYGGAACLTEKEFDEYVKGADRLYAYRLENPIRYGKPKTLSEVGLKRAPQSWCYLPEPVDGRATAVHGSRAGGRPLTTAADQWEPRRFATGDNGDRARAISGRFTELIAGINETTMEGVNYGETR